MTGTVFNIMHYALHDGPGIRAVVFLKGCPLSCQWCHNPEGQNSLPELMVAPERCIDCGECVTACPTGAAVRGDRTADGTILCTACGRCVEACLPGARKIAGSDMSVADVLRDVVRDRVFFEESGGGVTISGGEPFGQPEFLNGLVDACTAEGIATAVETCGMADRDDILQVAEKAVLFLYDLKLVDSARHARWTGVGNETILANLAAVARSHAEAILRYPVIPGANDDDDNVLQTISVMTRLGLHRIDLLPYHRIGTDKYRRLGRTCQLVDLQPPSTEKMESIRQSFVDAGIDASLGG
ncbi:MAG: glycyl-radical enzyme activating protein [Candidatus Cryosericum sp.]